MVDQQERQGKGGGGGDPGSAKDKNVAFSINSLHRTYQAASNKTDERDTVHLKWTRRTAISAIVYTVVTAALLAAGIWSAIQAGNAVIQAARAVGEAQRSADAAQALVATAKETEQRQLRAYVGVIPGEAENFGGDDFKIKLTRKNYGQTPAYDVGFSQVYVDVLPPNALIVSKNIDCAKPNFPGLVTMFPTTELPWTVNDTTKFSQDKINAVRKGDAVLYWYGNICYHDVFGSPHYTNFCWMYKGASMTAKDAEGCLQHNDSN
jgi:hypothetical protein